MQYVKFGNTGMDVSRICLGMMSFGKPGKENGVFPWCLNFEDGKEIFKRAIELGINYFDTANVYQMGSSEEITGRYIKDFGLDRDEIVVATKVNFEMRPGRPNGGGLSRKNIMAEIDHSLKRLQLDYVDVYQIHRLDPNTPPEEIMEALHDVVKSGKARVYRRVDDLRLATRTPAEYRGSARLDKVRVVAAAVQSDLPRRGTRNPAALHGQENGSCTMEPARRRTLRAPVGH